MSKLNSEIFKAIDSELYNKALQLCNDALLENNENVDAHILKGMTLREMGQYRKAIEQLSVTSKLCYSREQKRRTLEEMIECFGATKQYKKALYCCNLALKEEPEDIDLLMTKAIILINNAKLKETLIVLKKLQREDIEGIYEREVKELIRAIKRY